MILLARKPLGISSAAFAARIGRARGLRLGFSGTLDPFARGALLLACREHARLFRFLPTAPKLYAATIWLGASSPSLDDENLRIAPERAVSEAEFRAALAALRGRIRYRPPDFCAKKIRGVRAYELARRGERPELAECEMHAEAQFIALCGPFASFLLRTSRGAYVRSYAQLVCERLGVRGSLCGLERRSEGAFARPGEYEPFAAVGLPKARYDGHLRDILLGKKLRARDFYVEKFVDEIGGAGGSASIPAGSVGEFCAGGMAGEIFVKNVEILKRAQDGAEVDFTGFLAPGCAHEALGCVKVDLGEKFAILRLLADGGVKYELNCVTK